MLWFAPGPTMSRASRYHFAFILFYPLVNNEKFSKQLKYEKRNAPNENLSIIVSKLFFFEISRRRGSESFLICFHKQYFSYKLYLYV